MTNIVVIGGGFGGTWFANAVGARLLTRSNGFDINHDIGHIMAAINDERAKVVVNFASQSMVGQSWASPGDWMQTNCVGQANLVQALMRYPYLERYIHFTTPEVYGSTGGKWIPESWDFRPSTPYAASRAAGDWITRMWVEQYGFPAIFTRAANIYGEGQQLYRIIPKAILAKMEGTKLPLEGGGVSRRAFIHMDDVTSALKIILAKGRYGASYHISTDHDLTIAQLVHLIGCETTPAPDRPGKDDTYFLNSEKIRELGWRPTVTLAEGLERVAAWMVKNQNVWQNWPRDYQHKA